MFSIGNSDCQKLLKNLASLSLTMLNGMPCNLMILSINNCAIVFAVVCFLSGMKCAILLNLSITVSIPVLPYFDFGNSTIKSILMCSHGAVGMGRG